MSELQIKKIENLPTFFLNEKRDAAGAVFILSNRDHYSSFFTFSDRETKCYSINHLDFEPLNRKEVFSPLHSRFASVLSCKSILFYPKLDFASQ